MHILNFLPTYDSQKNILKPVDATRQCHPYISGHFVLLTSTKGIQYSVYILAVQSANLRQLVQRFCKEAAIGTVEVLAVEVINVHTGAAHKNRADFLQSLFCMFQ